MSSHNCKRSSVYPDVTCSIVACADSRPHPTCGGKEVPLSKLRGAVRSRGGYQHVTANKLWPCVCDDLHISAAAAHGAHGHLRKLYECWLLPIEQAAKQAEVCSNASDHGTQGANAKAGRASFELPDMFPAQHAQQHAPLEQVGDPALLELANTTEPLDADYATPGSQSRAEDSPWPRPSRAAGSRLSPLLESVFASANVGDDRIVVQSLRSRRCADESDSAASNSAPAQQLGRAAKRLRLCPSAQSDAADVPASANARNARSVANHNRSNVALVLRDSRPRAPPCITAAELRAPLKPQPLRPSCSPTLSDGGSKHPGNMQPLNANAAQHGTSKEAGAQTCPPASNDQQPWRVSGGARPEQADDANSMAQQCVSTARLELC
jgi:ARID/BRIGHT DNA binding domain